MLLLLLLLVELLWAAAARRSMRCVVRYQMAQYLRGGVNSEVDSKCKTERAFEDVLIRK